jgi:hypothetical protein
MAIEAWNLMDGQIDWQAVPLIAEILGVDDLELFLKEIVLIRDFKNGR